MVADIHKTRHAVAKDLDRIKELADFERKSFGFITRGTINKAILDKQIMVISISDEVVGFQHYYHRKRDSQTTFYHKAIHPDLRRMGLAKILVDAVVIEAKELGREKIVLKCPVDLPANKFHESYGFKCIGQEKGKVRLLNIWELKL